MKCTRCRARAEVQLRAHNAAFCRPCFLLVFRRQVEHFFRTHGRAVWGRGFDAGSAIAAFHRAAQITPR